MVFNKEIAGSMVQVGYDVALTRRKSRVQIPVDPYFIHKQLVQRIIATCLRSTAIILILLYDQVKSYAKK
jgi:hypothetical protein